MIPGIPVGRITARENCQYGELLVWILLVGRGTKYFAQSGRDAGVYFVLGRAATTEE